jgi:four helix bundle protein
MKTFNLEERLSDFSVSIIGLSNNLPKTKAGNHLAGQILRSGTSCSLNYGEAQSAESRKDFIHKMKIILKELRETFACIKIIRKSMILETKIEIIEIEKENNELIAIFVKSILTAESKAKS